MQIDRVGEQFLAVSVSYAKTSDCVAAVDCIKNYIERHPHSALESIRTGLDCVLIEYSPHPSFDEWVENLKRVDSGQGRSSLDIPTKQEVVDPFMVVPVCYDFGYDLPAISLRTGLSASEIIRLHSSREYTIWMIGFMPGFPYLGELPQDLQLPRKSSPDASVASGSVAIAEEYVGIYPFQSPGGWHVIGRTPLALIDYSKEIPWIFDYGMKVRFEPISTDEFERIERTR